MVRYIDNILDHKGEGQNWATKRPRLGHKQAMFAITSWLCFYFWCARRDSNSRPLASESKKYDVHVHHSKCLKLPIDIPFHINQ